MLTLANFDHFDLLNERFVLYIMDPSHPDQAIVAASSRTAAVASSCEHEEIPPSLKLLVDCWEHIFDYLALRDVHVMGQTCKRMNQLAGHYFREYCPELLYVLRERKIRIMEHGNVQLRPEFYQFIRDLLIRDQLDYSLDAKTFTSVKTLAFNASLIAERQIQHCQNVLENVESLLLHDCTTDAGDIFRQFAEFCPKLKYLDLKHCHEPNAVFKKVFLHHYPTLERMKYESYPWNETPLQQIDELKTFLEKHTQLKHFECDDRFLWTNRDLLSRTNVHLDRLSICIKTIEIATQFDHFIDFLWQLHDLGFYKTIHFSMDLWYDLGNYGLLLNGISTLPLGSLSIDVLDSFNNLSGLVNLTELRIGQLSHSSTEIEVEQTIMRLTKLQHLTIDQAKIDDIIPFVRHSKTLKTIRILELRNLALDSFALNQERKSLENGQKVKIQVRENVYLHEKWQSKNLKLSHVEIERFVAFKAFLRS